MASQVSFIIIGMVVGRCLQFLRQDYQKVVITNTGHTYWDLTTETAPPSLAFTLFVREIGLFASASQFLTCTSIHRGP